MNRTIEALLHKLEARSATGAEETDLDTTTLSPEEEGLLRAVLAWAPGMPDLERDSRVGPYLAQHEDHREVVRTLQLMLTAGRQRARNKS